MVYLGILIERSVFDNGDGRFVESGAAVWPWAGKRAARIYPDPPAALP
jgi:hypothetical protein